MVMSGRSVHLLGKLEQAVNQYFVHILKKLLVTVDYLLKVGQRSMSY